MIDAAGAGRAVGTVPMVSQWLEVTQPMIDQFGAVTLDPDPMHQDPAWAHRNSPFGGTIAYGFLTVSLLTHLHYSARGRGHEGSHEAGVAFLNYGFNKLRLVAPVRAGARIRGHFQRLEDGGTTSAGHPIQRYQCRIEIEHQEAPALVAEWLSVAIPAPDADGASSPG
jgi:acyl dehydratase